MSWSRTRISRLQALRRVRAMNIPDETELKRQDLRGQLFDLQNELESHRRAKDWSKVETTTITMSGLAKELAALGEREEVTL